MIPKVRTVALLSERGIALVAARDHELGIVCQPPLSPEDQEARAATHPLDWKRRGLVRYRRLDLWTFEEHRRVL